MLLQYICNNLKYFKNAFLSLKKSPLCRIEEIDLIKNIIVIHCRGVEAPIKLSFDEIINDTEMLSNFSSKHASWIGYYYGRYYHELLSKKCNYSIPFGLSGNHQAKCNITMVNRQGYIIYIDKKENTIQTMLPINILANESLILRFDPIQACYIGILSGISKAKMKIHKPSSRQLRLVK